MTKKIQLKGIAWDHPRGYQPLRATSKAFSEKHPEVEITWDIRSLKEFGHMPIEDLIDAYDLITIDHPYMGQAYANKLLLPLEERLPNKKLKKLEQESVGPSFRSYRFKDHLFALPIDAAALVAAARNDLLKKLKISLPRTREALLGFYQNIPDGYAVAWPLCPTDLWCTFLTLCAQDTGGDFIAKGVFNEIVGSAILDELKNHLKYLHPDSLNWNPIQVLDCMATDDHIIYSPFLFGYTNYSRVGYAKHIVNFSNSPTNPKHAVSTILGGVGLAISSKSNYPNEAIAYADYVASAEIQESIFTENGGQSGNLKAWQSEANNNLCSNFFADTLKTMQEAYVRPQHIGWNQFQEQGSNILHDGLIHQTPSNLILKKLNELYQSIILK